ncbi:response regulator transcription factor [Lapillicoccus jejuensis]|uniref:DNA-binding response OmpR family regulator n=1 Tax=Lapillicoccus jejuensis TaxID=402171 RepID=A0A542E0Y9_9MICO|nr:response regulator transcription factor [Lapillicoccus jejuensis]TQJ09010.1 DNA-binding response OmpR family regulator [Lapillicoccus jejuensis]
MRILLVEDERPLAEVVRRGLVKEGFEVDVLHDGEEALWRAGEQPYDVLVLDIMLPGLDGYQLVERLRERQVTTPVLMLTALDDEYDQAQAFDLGADDYLTKPFSFVVLAARLRALHRRSGSGAAASGLLEVGDLRLDPRTRRVHRGDHEIRLTAREFALLRYLMERPDEVVGKRELLDEVWDPGFDGPANVVEVYVGYLRRKLDVPFGVASLETVRGAGYRLVASPTP